MRDENTVILSSLVRVSLPRSSCGEHGTSVGGREGRVHCGEELVEGCLG